MSRIVWVAVFAFLLTGCVKVPAVISDISDSKVRVQSHINTPEEDIAKKANEGCAHYKKRAVYISTACFDQYCFEKNHLFACKR